VHTVQQSIFAGPVRIGLDLDRVEFEAIPDILRKYADPLVVESFPRIDVLIQDD
jgi:hypothetical protein